MMRVKSAPRKRLAHRLIGIAAALGLVAALSGCIIIPPYGPHYYRPYYYR
ncbi:MAG TPA: hypothetical protein VNT30_17385 [Stellaceae bacterium]|nr:hypothetical protein [Stellaceae bacterium]